MTLAAFSYSPVQLNAAKPLLEIRASATDFQIVTELGFKVLGGGPGGAAYGFGIGVPAASGIGPKASYSLAAVDNLLVSTGLVIATDWNTPPTSPTSFFRRQSVGLPGIAANLTWVNWRFPRGLKVSASSSLVLWSFTASGSNISPVFELTHLEMDG